MLKSHSLPLAHSRVRLVKFGRLKPVEFIRQLYKSEPLLVVDVGARGGFAEFPALRDFMEVYLLEPDPVAAAELRARYSGSTNSSVHEIALAASSGNAEFFLTDQASMSSLLKSDSHGFNRSFGEMKNAPQWLSGMNLKETISVKTQTLSEFVSANHIAHIDFLKLDTQGTELDILKSGEQLLRSGKVNVICAEVAFFPVYNGQAFFSDIDLFLRDCGFRLVECRTYTEVLNREDEYTMNGKLYEKPKRAPVGDAWYVFDWNPEKQKQQSLRSAAILASETYFSEAKHLMKDELKADEMTELFRFLSAGTRESGWKHFLRRWTPLAIQQWRAKNRK